LVIVSPHMFGLHNRVPRCVKKKSVLSVNEASCGCDNTFMNRLQRPNTITMIGDTDINCLSEDAYTCRMNFFKNDRSKTSPG
jgi:hypothetical protein